MSIFKEVKARNSLTVYEDDVFLVSYPRSGNTWTRFLLGTLLFGNRVTWHNMEEFIPDIYRNTDRELRKIRTPRILKSHHSFDPRYNKVIYLVRDVRDVIISYYYYHLKFKKNIGTLDDFIDKFIDGRLDDFGTWKENVESWVYNKDKIKHGFLLVRYEDMINSTQIEIQRILQFLKIKRSVDDIRMAMEWASFANMRKMEEQMQDNVNLFKKTNKEIRFMRQGAVAGWSNKYSGEQINKIVTEYVDLLDMLKYTIGEST